MSRASCLFTAQTFQITSMNWPAHLRSTLCLRSNGAVSQFSEAAPVHDHRGAAHKFGFVGGEEGDGGSDVFRFAENAAINFLESGFYVWIFPEHRRIDCARKNGVHANAFGLALEGRRT